ncbi:hypothetical protein DY000_02022531 [Brassica cretica]|uniref:Uncharacterized protein n=1 Tax=Brassica cretica TaxID=69181 RepID=A0ABQ7E1T4_BRACR|nr:hypothetical protein DY000_02022531 [Brassica cretica]
MIGLILIGRWIFAGFWSEIILLWGLGFSRRVVSLGVHEEMTPSSVQISVGVASCYIHLFRWISTVVYGAPNDTGLDSYSRVLDFWFMVVKNVEAILGGDWRQPDIVVMVKSTRFCMVRGEI